MSQPTKRFCGCQTAEQTGTINGYMCAWHRDRYFAALDDATRQTWEAAAQMADDVAEFERAKPGVDTGAMWRATQAIAFSKACRARAQEEHGDEKTT